MIFDVSDSLLFYSEREFEEFMHSYSEAEFKKRLKQNHCLTHLIGYFQTLFCRNYIVYKHYTKNNGPVEKDSTFTGPVDEKHTKCIRGTVRIWRNNMNMTHPPFYIGGIDYVKNASDDNMKIIFFLPANHQSPRINHNTDILFHHILQLKEGTNRICIDLHESHETYNNFWIYHGFLPTKKICHSNPSWSEFELLCEY